MEVFLTGCRSRAPSGALTAEFLLNLYSVKPLIIKRVREDFYVYCYLMYAEVHDIIDIM